MTSRRDLIFMTTADLVGGFLNYDRREDEDLPRNAIDEAVKTGEITVDEIVDAFRRELIGSLQ